MALSLDGTTGISASGNIVGNNISAFGSLNVGSFSPAILSASGNVTGGNIITAGLITATGNITGNFIIGNGSQLTGLPAGYSNADVATYLASGTVSTNVLTTAAVSATGNVTGGNIRTAGLISATGAITGAAITGTSLTVSTGNITAGNIVNANANGVGNIGSSTTYFNTVFARATSAQYADLAEMYVADADYEPGTVLEFGGEAEVTKTTQSHSTRVAGIVSTNPSYLMNATQTGKHIVPVALTGRVPCQVVGTIAKGDRLVASDLPGVATVLDSNQYQPACIIGKALENYNSEEIGTIEVAVGRT